MRAASGHRDVSSRLTFSLSIVSERPLAPLTEFERRWPRTRHEVDAAAHAAGLGESHLYGIGRFSVTESDWATRAELVDSGIAALLDLLDSTGIGPDQLGRPDVFVRACFTVPPGAETIRADTMQRLSRIAATLWIDA